MCNGDGTRPSLKLNPTLKFFCENDQNQKVFKKNPRKWMKVEPPTFVGKKTFGFSFGESMEEIAQ